jgi:hypothetical protein
MKKSILYASFLFSAVALLRGDESANYTPVSRAVSETFTSKILKIYSFEEGDSEYAAYVVNWKDHEVVVTPLPFGGTATEKQYKVGDTIRCQMQQVNHQIGDSNKGRMTFFIESTPSSSNERQRLDAIRAEIEMRRAERLAPNPDAQPTSP